jgi:hypothetical protein
LIATEISQIQHQLELSTDQQSTYHQQLLEKLVHMIQEQAASKEREERMLQEQAESKAREEMMVRMQQETIDRLIVNQQRVDAILVQNYELHEYPIPRLFVILPNSYQTWDPRSFLTERFKLYFLCECGEHCKADSGYDMSSDTVTVTTSSPSTIGPINVKNSLHLANHEGYEISRPTDFVDRYGPYVLGMLKVLKHCLTVANMITPVAQGSLDGVVQGVESMVKNTLEAVDMSIGFLEQKLENTKAIDEQQDERKEEEFQKLAALEGADLRRLDTFLRNKDQDKIMGNLYRITTDRGYVKWVCLEHYRESYRETAMRAFLQVVETSGGIYNSCLRKVIICLKSSTAAQDFFKRLTNQAPAVNELDVSLDWKFRSSDLSMLVEGLAKSNVRYLKLDLKEKYGDERPLRETMLPGIGKYQVILDLLSNRKLQGLALSNIYHFGLRTSQLSSSQATCCLRSFHFLQRVTAVDEPRLIGILTRCTGLVDLRLGSFNFFSECCPNLSRAIEALPKLRILHLQYMSSVSKQASSSPAFIQDKSSCPPYGINRLRELVCIGVSFEANLVEDVARGSSTLLEVLVLRHADDQQHPFNLSPTDSKEFLSQLHGSLSPPYSLESCEQAFSKLTHLDLKLQLTKSSMEILATVLPRLQLVHFGANGATKDLLRYINYASLKSIWLTDIDDIDLRPWYGAVFPNQEKDPLQPSSTQMESMRVSRITGIENLSSLIRAIPLKRLQMIDFAHSELMDALHAVNFHQLQELSIFQMSFDWSAEAVLAARSFEFTQELVVKYAYLDHIGKQEIHLEESRGLQGTESRLARGRVQAIDMRRQSEEYSQSMFGGRP